MVKIKYGEDSVYDIFYVWVFYRIEYIVFNGFGYFGYWSFGFFIVKINSEFMVIDFMNIESIV